jgi:hypothetical protein
VPLQRGGSGTPRLAHIHHSEHELVKFLPKSNKGVPEAAQPLAGNMIQSTKSTIKRLQSPGEVSPPAHHFDDRLAIFPRIDPSCARIDALLCRTPVMDVSTSYCCWCLSENRAMNADTYNDPAFVSSHSELHRPLQH